MYIQCKQGFVEADRWDGAPIPDPIHADALELARAHQAAAPDVAIARGLAVIVARSREERTLVELCEFVRRPVPVLESPVGWDYQWRAYLTVAEWSSILCAVADELDYRNFKSWSGRNASPARVRLAHGIWHEAHDAVFPRPALTVSARLDPMTKPLDHTLAAWDDLGAL